MDSIKPARPQYEGLDACAVDPVLEVLKRDIDWAIVERNLGLTTKERAEQLARAVRFIGKFRPLVEQASACRE